MSVRTGLPWCGFVVALFCTVFISRFVAAQTAVARDKAQLFQTYFDALATEPHTAERRDFHEAERERLVALIPTMSTAELRQAVSIIDAAIDQARISHDGVARTWAGMFLSYISGTKNGPDLMAPEMGRLSVLCSDPFTLTGAFRMFLTLPMQTKYPELAVPAMLQAIKAPDANSPSGRGPAYATILFLYPRDGDFADAVLVYMQRADLTGQKLLDFLNGIRASSVMPDAVVERVTRYLNDAQPEVRLAALRDIGAGRPAERDRVKPILQRLVDDPAQSDAFHVLAAEMLRTNKGFGLNPYQ